MCESRGGRSGLPVPNKSHGFCGRKETMNYVKDRAQERSRGDRWSWVLMADYFVAELFLNS